MPKIGMEPLRRRELIDAAIRTIGQRGSLDVTVAQIAHEAGVSPALAHHYFGGKDKLILATMRHLLRELGSDLNAAIKLAETPSERIATIIAVNFSASQFAQETIAAWLTFMCTHNSQKTPSGFCAFTRAACNQIWSLHLNN